MYKDLRVGCNFRKPTRAMQPPLIEVTLTIVLFFNDLNYYCNVFSK